MLSSRASVLVHVVPKICADLSSEILGEVIVLLSRQPWFVPSSDPFVARVGLVARVDSHAVSFFAFRPLDALFFGRGKPRWTSVQCCPGFFWAVIVGL